MSSIPYLPIEVILHILVRLPVKDLIRYTSVCKQWRCIITNPQFISTHLDYHVHTSDGYLLQLKLRKPSGQTFFPVLNHKTYVEHSVFDVPFSSEERSFRFGGSINGLIILVDGGTIYLWNPVIWKLKILRGSCFSNRSRVHAAHITIGFGFGEKTDDFKIVRILYCGCPSVQSRKKEPAKIEVYSLARNTWRKIRTNVGYYPTEKCSDAFLNGAVHWVASEAGGIIRSVILSFDLDSEKFGEIGFPKYYDDLKKESHGFSANVVKGSLALIACWITEAQLVKGCYVWVMGEYGVVNSWNLIYSICLEETTILRPLAIVNNYDFVIQLVDGELVSCDLEKSVHKYLDICKDNVTRDVDTFYESLVLYNEGFRLTPRKHLLVEGGFHLGKRKRSVYLLLQKKWR
ncbi:F-box protein [Melia azedarach]|uniref:F-box protein n=2 Tax=Melia azedarach TaxID=155640 RepID=A0ACC1X5Y0_MELAZ|nr:F-box protein [Melia azedarach]KAJ4706743.1 F-box protein [Melia azedarach]